MAGHSKWANIKHRKASQDAKRGKIFTKLIREITVAAQMGGDDVDANPRLRDVVQKALGANMTRDTVNRAVARGVGGNDGKDMETIIYEGYGVKGIAVYVECLSDNRNRTVAEIRTTFSKAGGNLGTEGSVAYLFDRKGMIVIENGDEDAIMDIALEAGADDVETQDDGTVMVTTDRENFHATQDALKAANIEYQQAELTMVASMQTTLDVEAAEKLMRMVDRLEDLDDVQEVYTNADIPDEVMENL